MKRHPLGSALVAGHPLAPVPADAGGLERAYLGLVAAGIALPYAQAVPWFGQHGLDVPAFFSEVFATRISSFFGWDVIVASTTLLLLAVSDRQLRQSQRWLVAAGALGGSSVGLPLYLWLRERNKRLTAASTQTLGGE